MAGIVPSLASRLCRAGIRGGMAEELENYDLIYCDDKELIWTRQVNGAI